MMVYFLVAFEFIFYQKLFSVVIFISADKCLIALLSLDRAQSIWGGISMEQQCTYIFISKSWIRFQNDLRLWWLLYVKKYCFAWICFQAKTLRGCRPAWPIIVLIPKSFCLDAAIVMFKLGNGFMVFIECCIANFIWCKLHQQFCLRV